MANPRKPIAQKKLEGTYQKGRDTGLKLPHETPVNFNTMEGLSPPEREFLSDIMGFLTEFNVTHSLDKTALLMMADAYRIYRTEKELIEIEGSIVDTVTGRGDVVGKENPRIKIMWGAWDRLFKLMNEFGLTPNARATLAVVKSEEDEMGELLNG